MTEYTDYLNEDIDRLEGEVARLQAIVDTLRSALTPFAAIGKTIVTNWPGDCRLRIDTRRDGSEYHCYHGEPEEHLGILPTLDQWRQAAAAEAST